MQSAPPTKTGHVPATSGSRRKPRSRCHLAPDDGGNAARQAGVRLRRQDVPAAKLDAAIEFDDDGWPCQRLAERRDCDAETVRQALKRAGIRLRAPWERHQPRAFIEVDLPATCIGPPHSGHDRWRHTIRRCGTAMVVMADGRAR